MIDDLPAQVHERTRYNLRNQHDLTSFQTRTRVFDESFFPAMTRLWNSSNPNLITTANQTTTPLTSSTHLLNPYFSCGGRKFQIIMARLRMKCSELAEHLCNMHIIDSPLCSCGQIENIEHLFLHCPLFLHHRNRLKADFVTHSIDFSIETILFGFKNTPDLENKNLLLATSVSEFLSSIQRFPLLSG